jgi:NADH-quinone oxidoreductase subunit C
MDKFPEQIAIEKKLPKAIFDWHNQHGDRTLIVNGSHILEISRILKEDLGYDYLVDITCVDYLPRKPRFEIVYHYMNMATKAGLRVKIQSDELHPEVASLTPLWLTANWLERETYDLYGVRFTGHPNLKRILLYEGFEGYPLRKDYPKQKRQPLIGPNN